MISDGSTWNWTGETMGAVKALEVRDVVFSRSEDDANISETRDVSQM